MVLPLTLPGSPAAALVLLAVACFLHPAPFFFGKRKKREGRKPADSTPESRGADASGPESSSGGNPQREGLDGAPEALSPELRRWCAELGLDDLEDFGLVEDLAGCHERAREELQRESGPELRDRTVRHVLDAAIARLDEPDVPREIHGQRLAAVITKCTEAADWSEMPECVAAAEACLAVRLSRPRRESDRG